MSQNYTDFRRNIEENHTLIQKSPLNKISNSVKRCGSTGIILCDIETKIYSPQLILCNKWACETCSSKKVANLKSKLIIVSSKEDMSFSLTLTSSPSDLTNAQKSIELDKLIKKRKKITTEYDKTMDLNKIMSRYKYKSLEKAQKKQKEIFDIWLTYEVEVEIKKIVKNASIIDVARKHNKYYKNLTFDEQKTFKEEYKQEIKTTFNKNYNSKKEELENNSDFMDYKKKHFEMLMAKNQEKQRAEFYVVEFNQNGSPHLHILSNRYIPLYLIEKESNGNSKIYQNDYLNPNLNEKTNIYKKSINYLLKSLNNQNKDEKSTYLILQDLDKNYKSYYLSPHLYKKYPFLKKSKTNTEKKFKIVERIQGRIKNTNLTFNPNNYSNAQEREIAYKDYKRNLTSNSFNKDYLESENNYNKETLVINPYLPEKLQDQLKINILSVDLLNKLKENHYLSSISELNENEISILNKLNKEQIEVIDSLLQKKLTICMGSAGVGKTTLLKHFNEIYQNKFNIVYSCFTAQSCNNINIKLNLHDNFKKAKTIHRTFNNKFSRKNIYFNINENNLLDADILVIDEFTLLDKEIFFNILKALSPKTHLLLLGDNKQLSNFKSNSLYFELINLNFPIIRLKTQYRSNDIVLSKIDDFFDKKDISSIYDEKTIQNSVKKILENKTLKILCNTNNLVNEINLLCLEKDSKNRTIKTLSPFDFKVGDVVMNTKNNYILNGLANGENLTILYLNEEKQVLVVERHLDNQRLELSFEQTYYLTPSYAITIHKSQGSEYDKGFIFIENTKGSKLCNQNIVYTACSRFKTDFELYFLDEKAKTKCYKYNLLDSNEDLFQFQKPKELLTELNKWFLSNPDSKTYDPSVI